MPKEAKEIQLPPEDQERVDFYHHALKLWKETKNLDAVAERLNVPHSVVAAMAHSGLTDLFLPPFPGAESEVRRYKFKKKSQSMLDYRKRWEYVKSIQRARELEFQAREKTNYYDRAAKALAEQIETAVNDPDRNSMLERLADAYAKTETLQKQLDLISEEAVVDAEVCRAADEAAAAQMTMKTATTAAAIVGFLADKILDGIQRGSIEIPKKLDVKLVAMLSKAADTSSSAVERAMNIERKRMGAPEKIVGVQRVGEMLQECSEEELSYIAERGELPPRLLAKNVIDVTDNSKVEPDVTEEAELEEPNGSDS